MTVAIRIGRRARDWVGREMAFLQAERTGAALRFREALRQAQRLLSEHPRAGIHGLIPETRILVKDDYLLSYRLVLGRDPDTVTAVEIFAIRHGRQGDARAPR